MVESEAAASAASASGIPDFFSNPQAIFDATLGSFNKALVSFINLLPNIVGAFALVIFGWFVGGLVARVFKRILEWVKFEEFLKSHRVEDALGNVQISRVLIQLVKYYIILVFVQAAVAMLALGTVTDFLTKVIDFAPKVIGAVLVVVLAAILGELVKEKVLEVHEKESYMRLIANGTKYFIIVVGVVMGLETLEFKTQLLSGMILTVLQAIGFAVALAIGLAFGFGGQEAAKEWVKEWRKRLHF